MPSIIATKINTNGHRPGLVAIAIVEPAAVITVATPHLIQVAFAVRFNIKPDVISDSPAATGMSLMFTELIPK